MNKKKVKKTLKYGLSTIGIVLLALIFLGYSNIGNLSTDETQENHYLKIGNERIRFLQKGNGKDILLIHGTPGSIEDWSEIIDTLSESYRVTVFDRLGHGLSSANDYTYHIKDNAILAEKLIKQLDLESPLVVGHSYGGSIVAHMAVNSKLKNLDYIIIDSPLYSFPTENIYKLVSIPWLGRGFAFLASFTIAKNKIKKDFSAYIRSTPQQKVDEFLEIRQKIWSQPKVIYSKSLESVNYTGDLSEISPFYKNIDTKITIITGKEAKGTFKNDCEKFHKEVAGSKLIMVENTAHLIPLEQPSAVIKIIKETIQ